MRVTAVRTEKLQPGGPSIFEVLDLALPPLAEGTVVAVASKIVAICEGRVVPREGANKDELIKQEASHYLPSSSNPYGVALSVARHILVAAGGIDESNAGDYYVLWPRDSYASANAIRTHLAQKHGVANLGVVITDSTTRPQQWGTTGIGIAYSGFAPLKNYIGTEDLFGRTLQYHQNNIMNGLAAAAALVMGEGSEQTPLAVIEEVAFVDFQHRDPTIEERKILEINLEDDVYAPLLKNAPWLKGGQ